MPIKSKSLPFYRRCTVKKVHGKAFSRGRVVAALWNAMIDVGWISYGDSDSVHQLLSRVYQLTGAGGSADLAIADLAKQVRVLEREAGVRK